MPFMFLPFWTDNFNWYKGLSYCPPHSEYFDFLSDPLTLLWTAYTAPVHEYSIASLEFSSFAEPAKHGVEG